MAVTKRQLLATSTLILLPLLASTSVVHAQEEDGNGNATTRYQLYTDDDETSVATVAIDVDAPAPILGQVGVHTLVDVVSTASVDVVSAATGRWTENRIEAGVRATRNAIGTDFGVGYTRSAENDWSSNTMQVGAGRDFFQRNFRVEASYGLVLNRVGRASDPLFERSLQVHAGELSVSQLIDTKSRVGASYTVQRASGFQSSPYRYVLATDGTRMPENHPEVRLRHALSATGVRALLEDLTGRVEYRYYLDDWGLRSHTTELSLRYDLHKSWFVGLSGRFYKQQAADFYRDTYDTALTYVTGDRELSRFWNVGSTLTANGKLGPLVLDLKLGFVRYKFQNFSALPKRLALITGAGVSLPW